MITKKEDLPYYENCCFGRPQSENLKKRKERQVFGRGQRTKKTVEH